MQKPVLLVIDVLNDFLDRWPPESRRRLTTSINELAGIMREFERPVIWVRQEFEPDLRDAFPEMRAKRIRVTIKGTRGCEIVPELAVDPSDAVVIKKRYSAFYNTILDETLARLKPDSLIRRRHQHPRLYSNDSSGRISERLAGCFSRRLHRLLRSRAP